MSEYEWSQAETRLRAGRSRRTEGERVTSLGVCRCCSVLTPERRAQARRQALQAERKQLPIWSCRDALLAEVRAHQVLVLVGETGSGKSTQLPQFLVEVRFQRAAACVAYDLLNSPGHPVRVRPPGRPCG